MSLGEIARRNRASAKGALWAPLEWPVDEEGRVRKQPPSEAAACLARRALAVIDFALSEGVDLLAAIEEQLQAQEAMAQ